MRIAVCIKQVPDTADLRIDRETNTLIREGVAAIMNPLDEFALEAALQIRERVGGTVTAFTMGPPQAEAVLHKAVAMGADNGVLVSDRKFAGADTWATSLTLAAGIRAAGGADLIMTGKQAIDGDTAQVGPGIAAHLGIPQVTYVTRIDDVSAASITVQRMLEHETACLRVRLPAVLTILKEANEPRLPTLAGRLRAYQHQPRVIDASMLDVAPEELGLEGSPTRVVKIAVPETARKQEHLTGTVEDIITRLASEVTPAHCAESQPEGS